MELAELQEDVVQQLQSMEVAKMQMAEQKLAEQTRLDADLDVRLQAACSTLDCSAGDVATDLTDQHQHVLCSSVTLGKAAYQILHSLSKDSVAVLVSVSAKTLQTSLPMLSLDASLNTMYLPQSE